MFLSFIQNTDLFFIILSLLNLFYVILSLKRCYNNIIGKVLTTIIRNYKFLSVIIMLTRYRLLIFLIFLCQVAFGTTEKTAEIVGEGFVKVHIGPSKSATVIAFVKKGKTYPVLWESTYWVKILYIEVEGWIERGQVKLSTTQVKSPAPALKKPEPPVSPPTRKVDPPKTVHTAPPEPKKVETKPPPKPALHKRKIYRAITLPRQKKSRQRKVIQIAADTVKKIKPESSSQVSIPKPRTIPAETLYVLVTISELPVFKEPDTYSPVIGKVLKDEHHLLLKREKSWFKIAYGDSTGWIGQKYVQIVDKLEPSASGEKKQTALPVLLILIAVALLIIFIRIIIRSIQGKPSKPAHVKHSVLIIALKKKDILYSLTNTPTTIEDCFAEIAFTVHKTEDLNEAKKRTFYHAPDVLLIDWQFSKTISQDIEQMISSGTSVSNIPVIFYNVPDPVSMESNRKLSNFYYLDIQFSVQELFKIVTRLIITDRKARTIHKSIQASALEGEIHEGSLSSVLQFVEIGKKTGCLFVDDASPFGIIYFEQGMITYVTTRNSHSRTAMIEILDMKNGQFRFITDKKSTKKNCNLSIMAVLMEWAQKHDENGKTILK